MTVLIPGGVSEEEFNRAKEVLDIAAAAGQLRTKQGAKFEEALLTHNPNWRYGQETSIKESYSGMFLRAHPMDEIVFVSLEDVRLEDKKRLLASIEERNKRLKTLEAEINEDTANLEKL